MGVLASLLPGLREVRTPLAAGYLWLVAAWVLLYDRVVTGRNASAAVKALEKVHEELGVGAAAAAVTFVAYLVGALWEAVVIFVSDRRRQNAPVGSSQPQMSVSAYHDLQTTTTRTITELDDVVHRALEVDPANTESRRKKFEEALAPARAIREARFRQREPLPRPRLDELREFFHSDGNFQRPRDDFWCNSGVGISGWSLDQFFSEFIHGRWEYEGPPFAWREEAEQVEAVYLSQVVSEVQSELALVARPLVGKQPELYLEASRMKAEIEFRNVIAVPVAVALIVIALRLELALGLTAVVIAVGLVLASALIADARRRTRARNDFLVELLVTEQAESPLLARVAARVADLEKRALAGREGGWTKLGR